MSGGREFSRIFVFAPDNPAFFAPHGHGAKFFRRAQLTLRRRGAAAHRHGAQLVVARAVIVVGAGRSRAKQTGPLLHVDSVVNLAEIYLTGAN